MGVSILTFRTRARASGIDQTGTRVESFRTVVSLNGEAGAENVYRTVVAILDGYAAEVAEIAADGTWLNVAATIEPPDGRNRRSTQLAPALRLKGVPVDHEYRRQIDPWPRRS
jgi:hypothetical protein